MTIYSERRALEAIREDRSERGKREPRQLDADSILPYVADESDPLYDLDAVADRFCHR